MAFAYVRFDMVYAPSSSFGSASDAFLMDGVFRSYPEMPRVGFSGMRLRSANLTAIGLFRWAFGDIVSIRMCFGILFRFAIASAFACADLGQYFELGSLCGIRDYVRFL